MEIYKFQILKQKFNRKGNNIKKNMEHLKKNKRKKYLSLNNFNNKLKKIKKLNQKN